LIFFFSGTINYAAPEIVDCEYNISVDLWAVGCITYFLLFGIPPFYSEADDDDEVMDQLMEAKDNIDVIKFPDDAPVSKEAKDFILSLLNPTAKLRPSASEAIQAPWFINDEEEDEITQLWENFKEMRVQNMPSDPQERKDRLQRIMSFVAQGKSVEEEEDKFKKPADLRKDLAKKKTSKRDSVRTYSSLN
jgi:serine/threonine protein kinase